MHLTFYNGLLYANLMAFLFSMNAFQGEIKMHELNTVDKWNFVLYRVKKEDAVKYVGILKIIKIG